MAGQADGSIIVDTEIDTRGFKADSKELQSAIKSLNTKVGSLGPTFRKALMGNTQAVSSFREKTVALRDTIAEAEAKLEALGNKRIETGDFLRMSKEAEKASAALNKLYDRQDKMAASGVKENSKAWQNLQFDIKNAEHEVAAYTKRLDAMKADGSAYTAGTATEEYRQLAASLEVTKGQLSRMNRITVFAKLGQSAVSAAGRLLIFRRASTDSAKAIEKLTKKVTGLWNMFKLRVMRTLIMGAINGLKKGFDNLAQYSNTANQSMSALKSGLTQLNNSFATAFAPILSAAAPALSTLINHLSSAVSHVGMFVAALTGAKTFTRATAVQEDYAKSLEGTGSAAQKAKRQLAGFDDLNILSDNSASGGAAIKEMFEEAAIPSYISGFASDLKAAVAAGDFGSIGELIGGKINAGLQKVNDFISWDNLGGRIVEAVTGFTSTINSLVDTVDWRLLGDTFAQGFNTAMNTVYTFLTTTDWGGIGSALAEQINGALGGIDWAKTAQTVSAYVVAWFEGVIGFFETADWQQIGRSVATFVGNIDWSGVISGFVRGLGALAGGVAGALTALVTEGINAAWNWLKTCFEEFGIESAADYVGGLLYGIVKAVVGIGTWIYQNIFEPFMRGFKNAFGIHSPSKVMAEQGEFIIEGLLNGITATWGKIKSFFSSAADSVMSLIKGKGWSGIGSAICSGIATGIESGWTALKKKVTSVAEGLLSAAKSALGIHSPSRMFRDTIGLNIGYGIGEGIEDAAPSILGTVQSVAGAISDEFAANSYTAAYEPSGINAAMTGWGSSVAAMMDAANAVANSAAYRAPAVAVGSVAPYEVTARVEDRGGVSESTGLSEDTIRRIVRDEGSMNADLLQAILEAIKAGQNIYFDGEKVARNQVRHINKMTIAAGKPVLIL